MNRDDLAVMGCALILGGIPLALISPWYLVGSVLGAIVLIVWAFIDYRYRTEPFNEEEQSDERRPTWPAGLSPG